MQTRRKKENSKAIILAVVFFVLKGRRLTAKRLKVFAQLAASLLFKKAENLYSHIPLFSLFSHSLSQRQGCYSVEGAVGGDAGGVFVECLTAYHGSVVAAEGDGRDIEINAVLPAALL